MGFCFSTDFLQWRFLAFASKNAPGYGGPTVADQSHIVDLELENLRVQIERERDRDRESALIEKLFEMLSEQQQEEDAA